MKHMRIHCIVRRQEAASCYRWIPTCFYVMDWMSSQDNGAAAVIFVSCVSVHRDSGCCWPARTQATNYSEAYRGMDTGKPNCSRVGLSQTKLEKTTTQWVLSNAQSSCYPPHFQKGLKDEEQQTVDEILNDKGLAAENNYVQVSGIV